jgi:hypothetical protein
MRIGIDVGDLTFGSVLDLLKSNLEKADKGAKFNQ